MEKTIERSNITRSKRVICKPRRMRIVVFNNDHTPFEVVVHIIMAVFQKSSMEALDITMRAQEEGQAVCAENLTREIAETLLSVAVHMSQQMDSGRLRFEIKDN